MLKKLATTCLLFVATIAYCDDLPVLRLGALETGTVNWELDTIKNNGLDIKNGFTLEVVPMAGGDASDIAFLGGEIDAMVSDVIWAASQRAEGRDVKFIPYSTSVGGIMVKSDSGITDLAGLVGKRIGIAGGPLDKNWLIFRAYAKSIGLEDLAETSSQEFGAPPVLFKAALTGDIDAVINFWHFQAKAKAAGMTEILSTAQASQALGLDPQTPLLGYIVNGDLESAIAKGLYAASREAKALLSNDLASWDAIRERMNAKSDDEFEALKAGFIAGIPTQEGNNANGVAQMLAFMAELGGEELVGKANTLPQGLFLD